MAKSGGAMAAFMAVAACSLVLFVSAEEAPSTSSPGKDSKSSYYIHTWPVGDGVWMEDSGGYRYGIPWAAFGSVGGVGGGWIFVPMLTLVVGFDTKSSAAISKCMIVGASASAVYYNIKKRNPMVDMPVIDYDLALLFQPMLVLGISIGVTFNVLFSSWMVTVVLIVLCLVTSIKAFFMGIEKWKKETIQKEVDQKLRSTDLDVNASTNGLENKSLPGGSNKQTKVSFIKNVHWKKLGIIVCVWIAILALQIIKSYTSNCSPMYWLVNLLQVPVAVAASGYEAMMLYKGKRVIASRGEKGTDFKAGQLVFYCFSAVFSGSIAGLVGVGGGAILGPLFLEMGIPPHVSSATATFAMLFSSSMSVVEYYLLKRFPIRYTLYFVGVTTIAALVGQYIVKRVIAILGRASLIIFILSITIFISAFLIGGGGIANMIHEIEHHKCMGFDTLCSNHS